MEIKLTKPFARTGGVDEFDTRQFKKALNRLGYYRPFIKKIPANSKHSIKIVKLSNGNIKFTAVYR